MVTLIQRGDRVSPFRRPPLGDVSGRSWQHLATLVRYKCVKTGEAQKESLTLHHLMPTRSSRFAGRSGDQDTGYRPAQSDLGATGPRLPYIPRHPRRELHPHERHADESQIDERQLARKRSVPSDATVG
jgi:hypothetical protein